MINRVNKDDIVSQKQYLVVILVPQLQKALDISHIVAVHSLDARCWISHGDDAVGDVRQVKIKAVLMEATFLL